LEIPHIVEDNSQFVVKTISWLSSPKTTTH